MSVESCLDVSSDHSPVILSFGSEALLKEKPPVLFNKNTNWQYYRELIDMNLNINIPLKTNRDIEEAVNKFTTVIQNAAWEATPKLGIHASSLHTVNYPIHVKRLIAQKRRLRRIWYTTRNPVDKTNFNRAARHLKQLLTDLKK